MQEIPEGRPETGRAKTIVRRVFRNENTTLIIILIVLIAMFPGLTGGISSRVSNMNNIMVQSTTRGLAAIGQTFVLLTGGIDIAVGGVGLLTGLMGAMIFTSQANNLVGMVLWPSGLALILLAGAGFGAGNGLLYSSAGIPALIATLGMWRICQGLAFTMSQGQNIAELPEPLAFIGQGFIGPVPVPPFLFIIVVVIAYFVLNYTSFGRSVYAAGGNPQSAWLSGINVKRMQFIVYIISGFLAALAAIVMLGRAMAATMRLIEGLELDSIAAATIGGVSLAGGRGGVIGVVIGVIIMGVINNGMGVMGADPGRQGIVKGAIIIVAVSLDYWRRRRR